MIRTARDCRHSHHLIHGYDDVDDDILWNIATVDVPPLAMQLRTILQTRGWA